MTKRRQNLERLVAAFDMFVELTRFFLKERLPASLVENCVADERDSAFASHPGVDSQRAFCIVHGTPHGDSDALDHRSLWNFGKLQASPGSILQRTCGFYIRAEREFR